MIFAQETFDGEIIVDNFAGGGGASTGIEIATGMAVALAINSSRSLRMRRDFCHSSG